jgi:cellobiose phosphorylase
MYSHNTIELNRRSWNTIAAHHQASTRISTDDVHYGPLAGRADDAYRYYRRTLPAILFAEDPNLYRVDPYTCAELIAAPASRRYGQDSHTGSPAWMWRACLAYIPGVRAEWDGLRIDPCIPAESEGYAVRREFRGATYDITVSNPHHLSRGVEQVGVDGQKHETNLLPVFGDEQVHEVKVVLG